MVTDLKVMGGRNETTVLEKSLELGSVAISCYFVRVLIASLRYFFRT